MTTVRTWILAFMACSVTNVRLLDLSQHRLQPLHPGSNMILSCIMLSGVKAYRFLDVRLVIVFGSELVEVTRKWRKLHNEELNYICSSHTNLRVIISRRIS